MSYISINADIDINLSQIDDEIILEYAAELIRKKTRRFARENKVGFVENHYLREIYAALTPSPSEMPHFKEPVGELSTAAKVKSIQELKNHDFYYFPYGGSN